MAYEHSCRRRLPITQLFAALFLTAFVMCGIAIAQSKPPKATAKPGSAPLPPAQFKKPPTTTTKTTKQLAEELAEVRERVATLEEEIQALRADLDLIRKQPNQPEPDAKRVVNKDEGPGGGGGEAKMIPPKQPAALVPLTAGHLTFQVKSLKPQKSYEYRDFRGNASITAKADDTLLVVNLSVQNGGQAWETFSSSSFRIVDKDGKPVDAPFQGFGNNVIASGTIGIGEIKTSDGDGNTFLKCKGKIDTLEPKNTLVEWELAPGKSHTETIVFVISAQTQGPRFEMVKK